MKLRLLVLYGSMRSTRQGIKAARFVTNKCGERGHEVSLVDPIECRLPLLDKMYKEYPPGGAPEALERLAERVKAADAYVIVWGEYDHTVPPTLANLLDHFLEEYFYKPSAIVARRHTPARLCTRARHAARSGRSRYAKNRPSSRPEQPTCY